MTNKIIGVLGAGFVGGAVLRYLKDKGFDHRVYDKFKDLGSISEINQAQIVFVCLPTPYIPSQGFDLSCIYEGLNCLEGEKIIVLKSTILPGATQMLQEKYPQHKFLFNPEFLREKSAYWDFINPDRQIVGYLPESRNYGQEILDILPQSAHQILMPATDAEMVKYMANSFLALKVVFANQFYDLCQKVGVDYDQVRLGISLDQRIGKSHLDVGDSGYRGYGGSCFPKDTSAIIDFAQSQGAKLEILETAKKINKDLLAQDGISEEFFLNNLHKNHENILPSQSKRLHQTEPVWQ